LRTVGAMMVAAAVVTMAVRHELVRRGLVAPLSMKVKWNVQRDERGPRGP
jgi:hypothetical protein